MPQNFKQTAIAILKYGVLAIIIEKLMMWSIVNMVSDGAVGKWVLWHVALAAAFGLVKFYQHATKE